MERLYKILLLIGLMLSALALRAESFTFIQLSDPQLGFFDNNKTVAKDSLNLMAAVSYINSVRPAFVIVTGDMVNSSGSQRQVDAYLDIISEIDKSIPVYHIPGNHDIGKADCPNIERYIGNYGDDRFSFRFGDCAFIGMNSCLIKDDFKQMESAQYKWLSKELKNSSDCSMRFVFTHCPVFLADFDEKEGYSNFSYDDRKKYWKLFKENNVTAVIAGHLHDNTRGEHNGIAMVTNGPVGRALGKGKSGLCVWHVDDGIYSYDYMTLDQLPEYNTLDGLVMAGYQGWFNANEDGAGLGWKHYQKDGVFAPGSCTVDLWPDVTEYEKTYATEFTYSDGTAAKVFSSHDSTTTDLHFRWMRDYGIDGAFMQRFVTSIRSEKGKANYNHILMNALDAAALYDRAICIMYDLSGISSSEIDILIEDWKELSDRYNITGRDDNHYLYHNGKPLVAVWGVGFNDNRKYNYDNIERVIDFLRGSGCSVLLGVPAYWRKLSMDTMPDSRLHELIAKADVVHPWFVGRFNSDSYTEFSKIVKDDIEWCEKHGKSYIPVLFPGFSWHNLRGGVAAPLNQIPRLGGDFFWQQVHASVSFGAKSLYLAMFDEIDEGTAFFKCSDKVPVGESSFLTYEGCEPDRYLWLAGEAGKVLRGEKPLSSERPVRSL